MKITSIKTKPILPGEMTMEQVIDRYLLDVPEGSVVAITSKIVSICEGNVVPMEGVDKQEIAIREADYYLSPDRNPYGVTVTYKDNVLIGSAGVDASNGSGHYVLWPRDAQASANALRAHLLKRGLKDVGVVLTDSRTTISRRGAMGLGLSHSGFAALAEYAGKPDVFGRKIVFEMANVLDGLAAAAVLCMGEGAERTPIVLIEDVPFVKFQDRNPSAAELAKIRVAPDEDVYVELLKHVKWDKRPGA